MNDQVAEIQGALDALDEYSAEFAAEHYVKGQFQSPKELMRIKNRNGDSIWLEMIKVRSELLLARAMATGPLAQAAEDATNSLTARRAIIHGRVAFDATKIFEEALEESGLKDTVRYVVLRIQEEYGSEMAVEFCKWLESKLKAEWKEIDV